MQRLLPLLTVFFLALFAAVPALAAGLEVNNITVATQAENGVKARDMAITKAERLAFGALVNKSELETTGVSDNQIARMVKGFSVQGEKLTARNYRANFTIRFLNAATNNFISSNGWQLVPDAASGQPVVFDNKAVAALAVAASAAATSTDPTATPAVPAVPQNIVILPVLDIGSRRVIWDEPNPWRDVWQQNEQKIPGATVSLPLGDVEDVTDIADASFLNGGQANVTHMLQRYNAGKLYVVIAKNLGAAMDTAGGMALNLYSHDGQQLKFIRKMVIHPRPGYLFNDAVPASLQMIAQANSNGSTTINSDVLEAQSTETSVETTTPALPTQSISGGEITTTVPYQSLQQWVSIQKRLRAVPGIRAVMPVRMSATGAQVRILTSTTNTDDLSRNLAMQKFTLQRMSNGEMVLVEQ